MKIIFILFVSILSSVLSQEWVDPHDMNTKSKRNLKKSSSTGNLKHHVNLQNYQDNENNMEETNSAIYIKRIVNLLLNSARIDESNPSTYHKKLIFVLDDTSFQFLNDFSNSENISLDQLRKLDIILSDMFRKRYLDDISDILVFSQDKILNYLFSKNSLPLVGLCVFIYIAYNLFRSNFSVWYVLRYFVFIIILLDYVQRYQQLYEEAEEHNMHLKYSTKCDTSKMSWGEYFKFLSSHEDCEKKVVSLLEVGLLQVKSIIIIPLSAAGTGLGHFGAELWDKLPFPWNILIFPLMLIFGLLLAVVVMTICNGTPFRVNLMHMFHLEFGEKKNSGIAGATLDKLLEAVGRPMIVDVRDWKEKYPQKGKKPSKPVEAKKSPNKDNKKPNSSSENGLRSVEKEKNHGLKKSKSDKAFNSSAKVKEISTPVEAQLCF